MSTLLLHKRDAIALLKGDRVSLKRVWEYHWEALLLDLFVEGDRTFERLARGGGKGSAQEPGNVVSTPIAPAYIRLSNSSFHRVRQSNTSKYDRIPSKPKTR